jgi:hypothetical protein
LGERVGEEELVIQLLSSHAGLKEGKWGRRRIKEQKKGRKLDMRRKGGEKKEQTGGVSRRKKM